MKKLILVCVLVTIFSFAMISSAAEEEVLIEDSVNDYIDLNISVVEENYDSFLEKNYLYTDFGVKGEYNDNLRMELNLGLDFGKDKNLNEIEYEFDGLNYNMTLGGTISFDN